MRRLQALGEPAPAVPDVLRAGIIRAVGEPQRKVAAAQRAGDFDAIENVVERLAPHRGVGIAQRTVFVNLVLKHVRD